MHKKIGKSIISYREAMSLNVDAKNASNRDTGVSESGGRIKPKPDVQNCIWAFLVVGQFVLWAS